MWEKQSASTIHMTALNLYLSITSRFRSLIRKHEAHILWRACELCVLMMPKNESPEITAEFLETVYTGGGVHILMYM